MPVPVPCGGDALLLQRDQKVRIIIQERERQLVLKLRTQGLKVILGQIIVSLQGAIIEVKAQQEHVLLAAQVGAELGLLLEVLKEGSF